MRMIHRTSCRATAPVAVVVLALLAMALPTVHAQQHPSATDGDLMPVIRNENGRETVHGRVKAVYALSDRLSGENAQGLMVLLRARPSLERTRSERDMDNWLRNEMMDKLVAQRKLPAGVASTFVAIYEDNVQDVVMRDYAVQHMTPIYDRVTAEEQAELHRALWNATKEDGSGLAGTALIALEELSSGRTRPPGAPHPVGGGFDRAKIGQTAFRIAGNSDASEAVRITAIQVCARMNMTQVVPVAIELAQHSESIPLRLSAIAALGAVGGVESQAVLDQAARSPDKRTQGAAKQAQQRYQARNNPSR